MNSGLTRRRTKHRKSRGQSQCHLLFPSLPAVRVFITCKRIKHPTQLILIFSFFFGYVSVFSFSDLLHRRSFFCSHLLLLRFRWPVVGRRCSVQRATVNLWPGVDGVDGSVCVLLDGLHSCRWQRPVISRLPLEGCRSVGCLQKAGQWRRGKRLCGVLVLGRGKG